MMKYCSLFLLTFALLSPFSLCAAEPTIHMVIVANGQAGFGANPVADYKNMERLFKENVPQARLKPILVVADEITPDKILDVVDQVNLTEKDTLVFYYSSRTADEAGNGGQYFVMKKRDGQQAELQRRTLRAALMDKRAKLTVLLTDCGVIEQKTSDESKEVPQTVVSPEKMSPVFEALFIKPEGIVDITSSKWGEASFVKTSPEKRGSCFTRSIITLLEKYQDDPATHWSDFVAELKFNVQKAFLESYPDGYRFDPPLNGIIIQKTQTIEIYGVLPGEPKESTPVARAIPTGPRFGVRAVNHSGGGVRITEIVPAGPGARAGFAIGDVILEINGTPIRNEQDYAKAVDGSPKTMSVKVVNAGDGRTINVTFELGH